MKKITYEIKPRLNIFDMDNKHPKCKGFKTLDVGWGSDYECGFDTLIDCDECKYGGGRKDPEAKCNRN